MTTEADVRSALAAYLPTCSADTVVPLGSGLDNVTFEVNSELIVRFSQEPDPAERARLVRREARLLTAVADISPLPVPRLRFTAAELGCMAYEKLPGTPLITMLPAMSEDDTGPIATVLGRLLTALHLTPHDRLEGLVATDDVSPEEMLREAAEHYHAANALVPDDRREAATAFLAAAPPPIDHPLVFSHNDLGAEHVLVDPATRTITGIIDWGDAALADPAYDLGLIYRDLGPSALDTVLRHYTAKADDISRLRARAEFYARCMVFADLIYGAERSRDEYVQKSIGSLRWLFAAPAS